MGNMWKTLEDKLLEESKDVIEYLRLSEEAEEAGDEYVSSKLKAAAYDEFTHGYTLCSILKHNGYEVRAEVKEHWHKAKEAFEDM